MERFDCGTGMGLARTKNAVDLGKWNNLKIYRHDWNGYVKLNDGPEAKGKSKVGRSDDRRLLGIIKSSIYIVLGAYKEILSE